MSVCGEARRPSSSGPKLSPFSITFWDDRDSSLQKRNFSTPCGLAPLSARPYSKLRFVRSARLSTTIQHLHASLKRHIVAVIALSVKSNQAARYRRPIRRNETKKLFPVQRCVPRNLQAPLSDAIMRCRECAAGLRRCWRENDRSYSSQEK